MIRTWLSFLTLQHIYKTSSSYNQRIEVQQLLGQLSLKVNGILQTGPYIERVFNKALSHFLIKKVEHLETALILGVGGGYIVRTIHTLFPECTVTAVDIDEVIVDVGKRFFRLPVSPKVHYVIKDAQAYVNAAPRGTTFDFIFVDLFIGNDAPLFVESGNFYLKLLSLLSPTGKILVNYHGTPDFHIQREKLENMFSTMFIEEHIRIHGNEIYCLQKKS